MGMQWEYSRDTLDELRRPHCDVVGMIVRIGVLVAIPRCPYFRLVTSTIYPEPSHFWFAQVPFYAYPDVRKCF